MGAPRHPEGHGQEKQQDASDKAGPGASSVNQYVVFSWENGNARPSSILSVGREVLERGRILVRFLILCDNSSGVEGI